MTALLFGIIYCGIFIFLVASVVRAVRYARAPVHLRWELYPVPHEEPDRVKHGGSYFESGDWWTKASPFNWLGEVKAMVPEMLFLKGLWEFNRPMWYRSFPFHFGLYLLIGTAVLVAATAAIAVARPGWIAGAPGVVLHYLYAVTGVAGGALAVIGATGLLIRRLTDADLKNYTTPGDIFNLVFFLAAFGLLFAGYASKGEGTSILGIAIGLLTFDTTVRAPGLLAAGLALASLLVAYIPMTHMSHFIAKYFTYHSVRWDDRPSVREKRFRAKVAECLTYRPTWAAPHVMADGKRSWADVAAANPAQESK
jgi:nitrate reductase gamma subunit